MTYEELKIEADKLGYSLLKKSVPIKFLPCVCGHNRRRQWYGTKGYKYECTHCGFKGGYGETERDAKIAWNKTVEEASK